MVQAKVQLYQLYVWVSMESQVLLLKMPDRYKILSEKKI